MSKRRGNVTPVKLLVCLEFVFLVGWMWAVNRDLDKLIAEIQRIQTTVNKQEDAKSSLQVETTETLRDIRRAISNIAYPRGRF